jgi:hypothetical protein
VLSPNLLSTPSAVLYHSCNGCCGVCGVAVQVDYEKRDGLEHKVERSLHFNLQSVSHSNSGTPYQSPDKTAGMEGGRGSFDHSKHGLCLDPDHLPEGVWGTV